MTGAQTLQLDSHVVCNLGQLTAPLWATDCRFLARNPLCFSLHNLFPLHFHPQSHCLPRHKPQASRSSIHLDISLTLPIWQVLSWVNFTTHVFSNANEAFLLHLLPPPTSTISPT